MPEPASKPAPSRSVPVHAARQLGQHGALYFPGKEKSQRPKPTALNPLNRLIAADSPTSKGLSKHRGVSLHPQKLVLRLRVSKCVMEKKEEEVKILPSAIIAFESVQISHTQPSQIALG